MVCDADTVINLTRESSKTRLMGINVHPSRKTEVEKKDENEELITIKNNSRNSSCSSTISQSSFNNDSTLTHGTQTHIPTTLSSPSNHMINNNGESLKNSEISERSDQADMGKIPSLSSVLSISSNLNLLEGDLPQTMLENFDIPCGPITPSIAAVVMNVLKQGGKLSFKSAHKILRISYKFLSELPNTTHCVVGPEDRLTVVGDLHGKQLLLISFFYYFYHLYYCFEVFLCVYLFALLECFLVIL